MASATPDADEWLRRIDPAAKPAAPVVGAPEPAPPPGGVSPSGKDQDQVPGASDTPDADAWLKSIQPPPAPAPPLEGSAYGGGHALAHHIISDLPIVGGPADWALTNGIAGLAALKNGTTQAEELAKLKAGDAEADKRHPNYKEAGKITAKAIGYATIAKLAPGAMGAGAPNLAVAGGTTAITMGVTEGIDALIRGEDPVAAVQNGVKGGFIAPYVGATLGWVFQNAIAPNILRLAQFAQTKGIKLGGDLVSANPVLKTVQKYIPGFGGPGGPGMEASRRQWRVELNRMFGVDNGSDNVLAENVANGVRNTGRLFDQVRNVQADIQMTPRMQRVVQDIVDDIHTPTAGSPVWKDAAEARRAQQLLDYVMEPMRRGNRNGAWRITPRQYLEMTQKGSAIDDWIGRTQDNPNLARVAARLKEELGDMVEQQLPPPTAAVLRTARTQWRVFKIIEPLIDKHQPGGGIIPPEALAPRVAAETTRYATGGGGEVRDLGEVGALLLKTAPDRAADGAAIMRWLKETGPLAAAGWWHSGHWGAAIAGLLPSVYRVATAGFGAVARRPMVGNALVNAASGAPGLIMQGAPAAGRAAIRGAAPQAAADIPRLLQQQEQNRP